MTHPSFKTNYVERVCLEDATSMPNRQLKTRKEIKKAEETKSQHQKTSHRKATAEAKRKKGF